MFTNSDLRRIFTLICHIETKICRPSLWAT